MASRVKYTPAEAGSLALGQAGAKVITSAGGAATPETGAFVALTVIDAVKFSTLTPEDPLFISETELGVGTELAVGLTIYGRWTNITISQGTLVGYYG